MFISIKNVCNINIVILGEYKMKVVGMIPIKLNNERMPGKNIKKFSDGTPLIAMIQRTCLRSKLIKDTYIYCSNLLVCEYLESGVKYLRSEEHTSELQSLA